MNLIAELLEGDWGETDEFDHRAARGRLGRDSLMKKLSSCSRATGERQFEKIVELFESDRGEI